MCRGRHLTFVLGIAVALVFTAGASGEAIVGYTATGAPTTVKPATQATYSIALTNTAATRSADRATVTVPTGFTVSGPSVQATATCGASTWTVEQPVPNADGKISVKRPNGSQNNLCAGGILTISFSAKSSSVEGTYTWTTELFRDLDTFVLSGAQPSVTVDATGPVVTLNSTPPNPSNITAPSFAFSANEPASFECRLDGASFAPCTSPTAYSGLDDGAHTFAVKATDAAGNTSATVSYTWLVETTLPVVTLTKTPNKASNTSTAAFEFSASSPSSTFECKLDEGAFEACSSAKTYSLLIDGLHLFSVKATDPASNVGPETTYAWTVDTVAPVASITEKPSHPSNDPSPSFSFAANEPVSFECKLDGDPYTACTSPKGYTRADGVHTFTLKATDPAGNSDVKTYTWTIDTVAPTPTVAGPPVVSNSASASFTFGPDEAAFACKLDSSAIEPCTSPKQYSSLAEGPHTFTLTATDPAGNTGQTTYGWSVDTVSPVVDITQRPNDPSNVKSPQFAFTVSEAATVTCTVDATAYPCASPWPTDFNLNLQDGKHTLVVAATDAAGNSGSDSYGWLLETNLPIVTLNQKPLNATNDSSATFTFEASKPGATVECRRDTVTFTPCSSPTSQAYAGLADGSHTFAVRARDAASNVGPETLYTWTIDTKGPTSAITERPADPTNSRSATFAFTSEPNATFQCRLDDAPFAGCSSPLVHSGLADGRHTFVVRAIDTVGNVGAETSYGWTVSTRAPAVGIASGPTGLTNATTATFSFAADAPSRYECSLDGGAFEPCSSPASYGGLRDGGHAFAVHAIDAAGNVGAASQSWTIDSTAPETTIDARPGARTTSSAATFRFSASEPGSFECRLDRGAFAACTSPKGYRRLASGAHSFAVRAVDAAGNPDATPAISRWTVNGVVRRAAARTALFAPAAGARVTAPPLLRWRAVRRATYYNVQLYRNGRKVLTAWPVRTSLQLRAKWNFGGRIERFRAGTYRWYVWPGFGRPPARRYGALLGTSTFVVGRGASRR